MDVEADWQNASAETSWTTRGGDYASEKLHEITVKRNEFGWVSFNVLKTVKDFIANPDKNFGFLLKNTAFSQEIDIATSEFETNADYRPKMVIAYPASTADLMRKRAGQNRMRSPVSLASVNKNLHIANTGVAPVLITLSLINGTTVASEILPGGARKTLQAHSAGVYLFSVSGNNFSTHEKVSLFH